ncbi:MAG: hypothetical protein AB8B83_07850 [Bdellovibrionales bacterium]
MTMFPAYAAQTRAERVTRKIMSHIENGFTKHNWDNVNGTLVSIDVDDNDYSEKGIRGSLSLIPDGKPSSTLQFSAEYLNDPGCNECLIFFFHDNLDEPPIDPKGEFYVSLRSDPKLVIDALIRNTRLPEMIPDIAA